VERRLEGFAVGIEAAAGRKLLRGRRESEAVSRLAGVVVLDVPFWDAVAKKEDKPDKGRKIPEFVLAKEEQGATRMKEERLTRSQVGRHP
jgi:hypothetical protein